MSQFNFTSNKSLYYHERATQHCTHPLAKKLLALLDEKETNLALSADVTRSDELLELADELGSEICVLKTHIDILTDFTPAITEKLVQLAKQHEFLIFEDRKFADIGHTVKQQYEKGIYHIADWADMINAHSLPGQGIITGLAEAGMQKNRGLLLLAQMSSSGNLMDAAYAQKTLRMAEAHPEFVIGFIAQQKLSDYSGWIYLTPGVQLAVGKDHLGQQYVTPAQAIIERQTDIIIVGRGILGAKNRLDAAKEYRMAGWESYLKRCTMTDSDSLPD